MRTNASSSFFVSVWSFDMLDVTASASAFAVKGLPAAAIERGLPEAAQEILLAQDAIEIRAGILDPVVVRTIRIGIGHPVRAGSE